MIRCRSNVLISLLALNLLIIFGTFVYVTRDATPFKARTRDNDRNVKDAKLPAVHTLCVIIPFRDRYEELAVFAPYMDKFLNSQLVSHHFLVMNQTDPFRFNRASLINVGWHVAESKGCSYLVMHDVDLLPLNREIDYTFPGQGVVRHISSPAYHPKYKYAKFIGGILMLTMDDYKKIDGMSNKYWGWGMEDDELYLRIRERSDLNLTRVAGLKTNRTNTFRHIHPKTRQRDFAIITPNQRAMKRTRDRISGLHNVKYQIMSQKELFFKETEVFMLDVALHCDLTWTPYCVEATS
ncbi:unnamed protein product, partial [Mesorhabditis belari]|uniref:Beta-1,4-galactosyltransferase 7 n=1 Tax=Mesorhabditis belari TaxID=2138241 RepID=A0AAF3J1E2_9BILA